MNEYDLKNASINIPYNDFNEIIKELNDLREFVKKTFWCCNTLDEIKTKDEIKKEANELNRLYEYWL